MRPAQRLARLAFVWAVAAVVILTPREGVAAPPGDAAHADKKPRGHVAAKVTAPKPAGRSKTRIGAKPAAHRKTSRPSRDSDGPVEIASIHQDVAITPFPSHSAAAAKALAQNRRDELRDAERAARAPAETDRWQTVLFDLRNLDARSDPEGCFWRLVAYYRMGELARARQVRALCELPPKDQAIIEAEDAQSADAQPAAALTEMEAGNHPAPVANLSPYGGASPTPFDH
jgi:hypothetical protein